MATRDVYVRNRDGVVSTGVSDESGRAMRVDNVVFNVAEGQGACSTISYVTRHGDLEDGSFANSSMSVLLVPPREAGESIDSYKKTHLVECVGEMLERAESEGFDGVVMRSDSVTRVYVGSRMRGNEYTLESVVDAKGGPVRTIDMDAVHEAIVAYNFGGKENVAKQGTHGSASVVVDEDPFGVMENEGAEDEILAF